MRNIPPACGEIWVKLTINYRQYINSVEEREVVSVQRDFKASERDNVYMWSVKERDLILEVNVSHWDVGSHTGGNIASKRKNEKLKGTKVFIHTDRHT